MRHFLQIVAAISLLATTVPGMAQPEPSERITIFAPYVVKKINAGPARAPIASITISRDVSYRDIDLKSEIGETILAGRVRKAAEDICRELDRRFPKSVYVPIIEDKECTKNATAYGMIQANAVVAAVRAS